MNFFTRKSLLTSGRRWTFRVLTAVLSGVALALMIVGPLMVWADNWTMIGISVVAAEIVVLFGGLAWLAMLTLSRRRDPSRSDKAAS